MKRQRSRLGLILTIAPLSPDRPARTVQISGEALAGLRLLGLVFLLSLAACLTWFVDRSSQIDPLLGRIGELEGSLRQSQERLTLSQASLAEVSSVTAALLEELGSVGAAVREVQALSGREPDAALALEDLERRLAAGSAVGGIGDGDLPLGPLDALGYDLRGAADLASRELDGLWGDVEELRLFAVSRREATPAGWPVDGWISSDFGMRRSPISGRRLFHKGVDLVAPYGTPVLVSSAGDVIVAGWSAEGYGNHVIVDHGHGYRTLYAHLSELSVEEGDTVEGGDVIGLLGNTGYSTGPHLHYEVWVDGSPANPHGFLSGR